MSQPDATTPTDGASALLAAAEKSGDGPRRKARYIPKAKKEETAPADSPAPAAAPAQEAAEKPEPVPAPEDTGGAATATQKPSQPEAEPKAPEAPASSEAPAAETPAPEADDDAAQGGSNSTTDVAFPVTPLRFESVFTRPTHTMDPEMFAMFRQRQEKILKSLANIVKMFLDRKEEYEGAVRTAVAAGFPKDELAKLAVQHDCAPFLEAVLGELPNQ